MDQQFCGQQEHKCIRKINQLEWKWNHLKSSSHGTKGNISSGSLWTSGLMEDTFLVIHLSQLVCLPKGFEEQKGKYFLPGRLVFLSEML